VSAAPRGWEVRGAGRLVVCDWERLRAEVWWNRRAGVYEWGLRRWLPGGAVARYGRDLPCGRHPAAAGALAQAQTALQAGDPARSLRGLRGASQCRQVTAR